MRKEYYNYVVKLPVLLHELFRGKVADYHFSDMIYMLLSMALMQAYTRKTDINTIPFGENLNMN